MTKIASLATLTALIFSLTGCCNLDRGPCCPEQRVFESKPKCCPQPHWWCDDSCDPVNYDLN